jgi:hypothetical protein
MAVARLALIGHALMENRNGLIVGVVATRASGPADRPRTVTLAGDESFNTQDFVADLREINVTLHVAQNANRRGSAVDSRTARHPGYAIILRIRKRVEEAVG